MDEGSGDSALNPARPDRIAEELAADEAVKAAATVQFMVPNQLEATWCVPQLTVAKAIMAEVDAVAPAA
ncbi:hypothetical protein [Streptomyces sp. NPDC006999]